MSGEETHYLFRYELKEYVISSDTFGMKLTVHVYAAPYPRDPIPGFVADKFAVFATVPNSSEYFSIVFQAILDPRTWPEAFDYITELGEVEIFDKPFDNVLQLFAPLDSNAMFNYDVGVVSFSDVSGKQWRWERWE
jgi:hypothetical protein